MNYGNVLELDWWLDHLIPVVNKICDIGENRQVDLDFWRNIYKKPGSSSDSNIQGWINVFHPYSVTQDEISTKVPNQHLDWKANSLSSGLTYEELTNGISEVPFIWDYHRREIEMCFNGGFMGPALNDQGYFEVDYMWAVVHKNE